MWGQEAFPLPNPIWASHTLPELSFAKWRQQMGWGWGEGPEPEKGPPVQPAQCPPFVAHSQGTSSFLPPARPASRSENSFRCFLS